MTLPDTMSAASIVSVLGRASQFLSPDNRAALDALNAQLMSRSLNSAAQSAMPSDSKPEASESTSNTAEKPTLTRKRSRSSDDDFLLFPDGHDSAVKPEDSAEDTKDIPHVAKRARTRQKNGPKAKAEKQKHGPKAKAEKHGKKKGWRAAEDGAVSRTAGQRQEKQAKWAAKKKKVKMAWVKTLVKNAFGAETTASWKGKKYEQKDVVPEKKRGTGNMGQPTTGRGCRAKPENLTSGKIEERYGKYKNEALKYAKYLSKIERFEEWGKAKKMAVRNAIVDAINGIKLEELQQNGY